MNKVLAISKYQLKDLGKSMMVFYIALMSLTIFFSYVFMSEVSDHSGNFSVGGFGGTTTVFIFIAGLNCFKANFKFFKANNISAKFIYIGTLSALFILALTMSIIDTIINEVLTSIINYESLHFQLYQYRSFISELVWSLGLYTLFAFLGWMITMIYYRSNTMLKIIISVCPWILLMIFARGPWINVIVNFLNHILGFSYGNNAFIGAVSFITGSVLVALLCYLLIYRAPIKK